MLDTVFNYFAIAIIFIASFGIYFAVAVRILPSIMLKPITGPVRYDRGIRKCVFAEGRGVNYEPRLSMRKYMSQYVLYSQNGEKFIKCRINGSIHKIKYEITVYNRKDRVIGAYEISHVISEKGYTPCVKLPDECSYVNMNVISVNDENVAERDVASYSGVRIICYAFITVLLTAAEGLFCSHIIKFLLDTIYRLSNGSDYRGSVDLFPLFVIAALCGAVLALLTIFANVPFKSNVVFGGKNQR